MGVRPVSDCDKRRYEENKGLVHRPSLAAASLGRRALWGAGGETIAVLALDADSQLLCHLMTDSLSATRLSKNPLISDLACEPNRQLQEKDDKLEIGELTSIRGFHVSDFRLGLGSCVLLLLR